MREKIQHSNFSKRIGVFLIFPLILLTSFSFPRPAHAAVIFRIVNIIIDTAVSVPLFFITGGRVVHVVGCSSNLVWGCDAATGASVSPTVDGSCSTTHYSCAAGSSTSNVDGFGEYTWSCAGAGGGSTASCSESQAATASLSASPSTIDAGQSSTLTWSSADADSCTSLGGFSTGDATSGSVSVGPLATTQNYQISCTGPGGSGNSNTATVTVLVPTVTISAAPDRVVSGGVSTVSWSATNVNACTITRNGVAWQSLTSDASRTLSSSAPDTITAQTTYVITCTNNASVSAIAATATQIVNIVPSFEEF